MTSLKIMLFDLSIRGHHPNYIQHLIRYWHQEQYPGDLHLVVSPRFLTEHASVVQLADALPRVHFTALLPQEEAGLASRKSQWGRKVRNFQEWQLLQHYAQQLQATHCVILYLDTYILPLALGGSFPCPLSGIYFRPTFHYSQFTYHPTRPSLRNCLQMAGEKWLLSRLLNHPQFQTLFSLDPFVLEHLPPHPPQTQAIHLPDPVDLVPPPVIDRNALCERFGIDSQRHIALLFGALNSRKGINQLFEAIAQLPPSLTQKLCLLLVGESSVAANIDGQVQTLCQNQPIQIVQRYEFIPDAEIPVYFQLADLVLAPYQRHVGMSGILLLAAAAQKPVLSSNYGLMGEVVKRYELGISVDSTQPTQIAQGLSQFLSNPCKNWGNPQKMSQFAQANSADQFAQILFQSILSEETLREKTLNSPNS